MRGPESVRPRGTEFPRNQHAEKHSCVSLATHRVRLGAEVDRTWFSGCKTLYTEADRYGNIVVAVERYIHAAHGPGGQQQ